MSFWNKSIEEVNKKPKIPDIKEADKAINGDIEKAKFILDEGTEKLKATIDSFKNLQFKNFIFIGYSIWFMNFLCRQFLVGDTPVINKIVYSVVFLLNIFSLYEVCTQNLPRGVHDVGNNPRNLLDKNYLGQDFYKMILGEAYSREEGIFENLTTNRKMGKILDRSFKISIILLAVTALTMSGLFEFFISIFK